MENLIFLLLGVCACIMLNLILQGISYKGESLFFWALSLLALAGAFALLKFRFLQVDFVEISSMTRVIILLIFGGMFISTAFFGMCIIKKTREWLMVISTIIVALLMAFVLLVKAGSILYKEYNFQLTPKSSQQIEQVDPNAL